MSEQSPARPKLLRFSLASIFLVLAVCGAFFGLIKWSMPSYPYGWSHCCDKQVGLALMNYAQINGGRFPTGGATPKASLSLLYPQFLDANTLRGKTVPEDVVAKVLKSGRPLTPTTCGWQYVDGLTLPRQNTGRIAIFWDKVGLGHNGERLPSGGHSVGFMDGHTCGISEADWPRFLAEQETAWSAIRRGEEPTPPWLPEYAN